MKGKNFILQIRILQRTTDVIETLSTFYFKIQRRNFFKAKLPQAENDIRKTWRVIKEAPDTSEYGKEQLNQIKIDNNIVTMRCNPKLVLDQTNNHFINIGKIMTNSIAHKLSKTVEEIEQQFIPRTRAQSTTFLLPVVEQEILEVINTLHNDSAPGLDGIDNKDLKGLRNIFQNLWYTYSI
jgi:hypothetical protein